MITVTILTLESKEWNLLTSIERKIKIYLKMFVGFVMAINPIHSNGLLKNLVMLLKNPFIYILVLKTILNVTLENPILMETLFIVKWYLLIKK